MATGPSLLKYTRDKQFKNAIHMGVNKVAIFDVDLDYYFMADWTAIEKYGIQEELKKLNAQKFIGLNPLSDEYGTTSFATPMDFIASIGANPFFAMHYASQHIIQPDISKHPLFGYGSIIIPCFHFALFCKPRRIYLVGCDCSSGGHFDSQSFVLEDEATKRLIAEWGRMKQFAKYYYPDVEIIAVNPIGLKGMFREMEL